MVNSAVDLCKDHFLLSILTSLIASIVWAAIALVLAAHIRRERARRFLGTYEMRELYAEEPRGGTVTIEYAKSLWGYLILPTPLLSVFAEHGTGPAPGTEDWSGTVEVVGPSHFATGFYWHPNGQGGALRFVLSEDFIRITEHGIPHDPAQKEFVRLLVRRQPKLSRGRNEKS